MSKKDELLKSTRWIADDKIRAWVEKKLDDVPSYFWEIPASTSGKYHPEYSQGEGGLVRHTRAVVFFVIELSRAWELSEKELDMAIAATVLHDTWKCGKDGKHTVYEHPEIAAEWAREDAKEGSVRWIIADMIETHMGQWGNRKPKTKLEWFLHTADYLASRKQIIVPIDEIKC